MEKIIKKINIGGQVYDIAAKKDVYGNEIKPIYVQETEPVNAPIGAFWIDTSNTQTVSVQGVEF